MTVSFRAKTVAVALALATVGFVTVAHSQSAIGNFIWLSLNGNRVVASASGSATITVPASTDTLVGKATSDTLTNKTVDAEGTGNVLTVPFVWTPMVANCDQFGGAYSAWETTAVAGEFPALTCLSGSNGPVGVFDFEDTSTETIYNRVRWPADWTGTVDLVVHWLTAATTGNVVWQVQTACVADNESADPSWNAAQTITDAAKATGSRLNVATLSTVTVTGCAAGELFKLKLFRDPSHASDTIAATASLVDVALTYRRAL